MAQTIGQILQKEREHQGLSVIEVAGDTRIPANMIRALETDDYSVFSSSTYARRFLLLYSRHLEVDADDALHEFDSITQGLNKGGGSYLKPGSAAIEEGETIQQHLHSHADNQYSPSYRHEGKRTVFPLLLAIAVLLLLLLIPIFYYIGKKANSLEEATAILNQAISSEEKSPAKPNTASSKEQDKENKKRQPKPPTNPSL